MPPRLRPTRLEHVVDGVRLRAQLSAAAHAFIGDQAAQRKAAIEVLRAALFRGRMIAKERLESGAGGVETARLLVEADELPIERIASKTGFADPERMRRAFLRTFGEPPQSLKRAARARRAADIAAA